MPTATLSPTATPEPTPVVTPTPETSTPEGSTPTAEPTPAPVTSTPIFTPLPTEVPTQDATEAETPKPREDAPYYDPEHVIEVNIVMDPEDFAELANQARSFYELLAGEDCMAEPPEDPYTWFPADVTIDGNLIQEVGVRKKGFFGSSSTTKPGLKIEFDEYVQGQEFAGMERMTLNNSSQDPSLIHQCMTYFTFGMGGRPVPRCTFAHVSVNGDDLGVYVNLEPYGKDWLRQHYEDDDGDLYEGAVSDFREGWTATFEPKTKDTDPDLGPIHDVEEALLLPDDELLQGLSTVLDVDKFLSHWALEVLVGHWDSYTGGTNNFYVYRDPTSDRVELLPWGADDSFDDASATGQLTSVYLYSGIPWALYTRLPEMRAAYLNRLQYLLDIAWQEDVMLAEVDRIEDLILPYYTDPETLGYITTGMSEVRTYISGRRAILEPIIAAGGEDTTANGPSAPWCIPASGTISASFSARWYDPMRGDPLTSGESSADVFWKGEDLALDEGGAIAGPDEERPTIMIGLPEEGEEDSWYRINLRLPDEWLKPGTYEIDSNGTATATIDHVVSRIPQPPVAVIFNGILNLEKASNAQGAPVVGSFEGELFPVAEED